MSNIERPYYQLREIDDNSWLLAGKIVISRQSARASDRPCWETSQGDFFTISECATPAPQTRASTFVGNKLFGQVPHPNDPSTLGIWAMGDAWIQLERAPSAWISNEYHALKLVQSKGDLGFVTPPIHYFAEFDGWVCLVIGQLDGPTVEDIWHTLQPNEKTYYIEQAANMVQKLAEFESDKICGASGIEVAHSFLHEPVDSDQVGEENRPVSGSLAMDCSTFNFSYNNFGPWNIVLNGVDKPIGVVRWMDAGFFPKAWTRTLLRTTCYMDIPTCTPQTEKEINDLRETIDHLEKDQEPPSLLQRICTTLLEALTQPKHLMLTNSPSESPERRSLYAKQMKGLEEAQEWRSLLEKRLADKGFPECADEYLRYGGGTVSPSTHFETNHTRPLVELLHEPVTFKRTYEDKRFFPADWFL